MTAMNYETACQWLGLDPHDEIDLSMLKSASRRVALREHPDKSKHEDATARFQNVQEAQELITQQIQRGATGASADLDATYGDDDDGYYYDDDDDDYDDPIDLFRDLFAAFVFESAQEYDDYRDRMFEKQRHTEEARHARAAQEYEDYIDRMFEKQRRKEEARRAEAAKRKAHEEEMIAKRRQAMIEGRDFFEDWNVKQLQGEARNRGINIQGLQRVDLIALLIEDEAKQRLRRQHKETAPLIDEYVEIYGLSPASSESSAQQHLNGVKARATDYFDGRYTVEWEDCPPKKKSQHCRHMNDKSKKARLKPANVRLWGAQPPVTGAGDSTSLSDLTNNATDSGAPNKKKKSRKERKQAAKQRHAAKEQQRQNRLGKVELHSENLRESHQSDEAVGDQENLDDEVVTATTFDNVDEGIDKDVANDTEVTTMSLSSESEHRTDENENSKEDLNPGDAQDNDSDDLKEMPTSVTGGNDLEESEKPGTTPKGSRSVTVNSQSQPNKHSQPAGKTEVNDEDSAKICRRDVLIESRVVPIIIGKKRLKLVKLMKKSGTKIAIDRKSNADGMSEVRITGMPSNVETASKLVLDAAARAIASFVPRSPKDSSVPHDSIKKKRAASVSKKVSVSTNTKEANGQSKQGGDGKDVDLLTFLVKQQNCLKCPPVAFYEWLIGLDVHTMGDLLEACTDNTFVETDMQLNGLKGFKRGPFIKAVQQVAASV